MEKCNPPVNFPRPRFPRPHPSIQENTLRRAEGGSMKSTSANPLPIRIGVLAVEPVRVAGLASIFDQPAQAGQAQLVPVIGSLEELAAASDIEYVVVDLH